MDARIQKESVAVGANNAAGRSILVDTTPHPAAAITRACYALADIATFEFTAEAGAAVRIFPSQGVSIETVTERFRTAVIDFTLREDIEARTKGMRELIWQTAFGEVQRRGGS
jgi:His-Xaa-Ser system protein HxsD